MIKKWYVTVSEPAAVTNSCKARTERACSITNTHCDRSGGMFCKQRKQKHATFSLSPSPPLLYFVSSTGNNWAAVRTLNTLPYPRYSRGNSVDYQIPRLPGKLFHRLPCRTDIPYPPTNSNSIFDFNFLPYCSSFQVKIYDKKCKRWSTFFIFVINNRAFYCLFLSFFLFFFFFKEISIAREKEKRFIDALEK